MECRPNLYPNAYPTVTTKITSKTPGMYYVHPKHISLWSEIWDKQNNPKSNLDHTQVQATLQPGTPVLTAAASSVPAYLPPGTPLLDQLGLLPGLSSYTLGTIQNAPALPVQASLQPGSSVFTPAPVPVSVKSYLLPGAPAPAPAYLPPRAPLPVQPVLPPGVSDSKFATIQSSLPPGSPAYAPALPVQATLQPGTSVFTPAPAPVLVPACLPPGAPLPVCRTCC